MAAERVGGGGGGGVQMSSSPVLHVLMKNVFFVRHASENALHGLVVISVSTFSLRWNNGVQRKTSLLRLFSLTCSHFGNRNDIIWNVNES